MIWKGSCYIQAEADGSAEVRVCARCRFYALDFSILKAVFVDSTAKLLNFFAVSRGSVRTTRQCLCSRRARQ